MQIHAGFPFPSAADVPSVRPPCDGRIEEVASGAVQGWVAATGRVVPEVELLVDGVPHLRGPADRQRPDLPWPALGFAAPLPEPLLDGRPHRLELRIVGGAFLQGGPVDLEGLCPCDGAVLRVAGGRVFGRVRAMPHAGDRTVLELWDDGVFLLRFAVADHPAPAGEGAAEGEGKARDGRHGFALPLPPRCFDGANHELRIRDALGRDLAGSPFGYQARPPDHGGQGPMLERAGLIGHLEAVEGRQITGWALDAFAPGRPVELELCEGEEAVGRLTANRLRPPPLGDGSGGPIPCGFAAEAPESWLDGRPRRVTLRFAGTDIPLRGMPPTLTFLPPSGSAARIGGQDRGEGADAGPSDAPARLEALQLALAERDRQISLLAADLAAALSGTATPPPGMGAPPGAPRRVVWCAPPDARTRPALDDVLAMLSRIARDIPVEFQRMPVDPPSLPLPCDLALVPAVENGSGGGGLARPAILAALARGIPVLAAADPGLPASLRDLAVRDWEREARRHLAAAAVRSGESAVAEARPAVPAGRRAPVRLLILIDLPEEVDLLEPVAAAAARRARAAAGAGAVALTAVLTDHAATRSTRARAMLARHGIAWTVAERSALLAGRAPDLSSADAVLVGAESDHPSHCVPHALLGRASALGIPCFAVQHGLETIGLTYFDEVHDAGVRLGGDRIFTWFPVAAAPAEMAAEVRRRLCPVGSLREPTLVRPALPAAVAADGRPLVGVFENLHWHRYDDRFRAGFVEALSAAAAARPALRFLVKPHHSARWLGQMPVGALPGNVILADPADPAWEPFTAPALMPALAAVVTTPSTVAHDAARAARPVAVAGGDLVLPVLAPLPILRRPSDWLDFLDGVLADGGAAALADGQMFLDRHMVPGPAGERILDRICDRVQSTPKAPA
ncbi:hypothetical protein [Azospirillum largimobile]